MLVLVIADTNLLWLWEMNISSFDSYSDRIDMGNVAVILLRCANTENYKRNAV